jgi:hypothetical protein
MALAPSVTRKVTLRPSSDRATLAGSTRPQAEGTVARAPFASTSLGL